MLLNNEQLKRIKSDLNQVHFDYKYLYDDLLDHICCIVEEKMETGKSFEEAYQSSKKYFPESEIQEIQNITLKQLNMEKTFSNKISILSTIPFVLLGMMWIFTNDLFNISNFVVQFVTWVSILTMFGLFGLGWVKEFPRWSIPSVGFSIIFTQWLMAVSIPQISGNEVLGLWGLLPFLLSLAIAIMIKPSLQPIKKLYFKIKEDKSIVLLMIYGIFPLLAMALCDEIFHTFIVPIVLLITTIIGIGLFVFLRSPKKIIRVGSLLLAMILSVSISILASGYYWDSIN